MEEQVKRKEKRGYIFSLDALIALIVIVALLLAISPSFYTKQRDITLHHDILNVLLNVKVGESNNTKVKEFIRDGLITDTSKSLLEQMALFYAMGYSTEAETIAKSLLDDIAPSENVNITFDDGTGDYEIAHYPPNPSLTFDKARNIWVARQVIGGIQKGNVTGFSARAFLTRVAQAKYFYFGGYIGQGNISANIEINGTVINAGMELAVSDNFTLYVNDNFVRIYTVVPSPFVPNKFEIPITDTHWKNGNNTLKFVSQNETNFYIAGGYIKVLYSDSEYVPKKRHYIPGIEGIINLYDSFYIPGVLNSMNIFLRFNSTNLTGSNVTLTIGNVTVYNKSSEGQILSEEVPDSELSTKLNYNELSNKTIPIRLWTPGINFTGGKLGEADVVLVLDVSGSMASGVGGSGTTPDGCYYSNTKISLLKCVAKNFTRTILSNPENRVGLVSYSDNLESYHPLSNDENSLTGFIDSLSPLSRTCTCCGINKAYELLGRTIVESASEWKYFRKINCGDSCDPATISGDCNVIDWNQPTFDDSLWSSVDLPYGLISEAGVVTYFRKHFVLTSELNSDAFLGVSNQRGVECYLNGNFINIDSSCTLGDPDSWNHVWDVSKTYFNPTGQDNVLACRIRSGTSWSFPARQRSYFNSALFAPTKDSDRKKFISLFSDGLANVRCTAVSDCSPYNSLCSNFRNYPVCYAGISLLGADMCGTESCSEYPAAMHNANWSAGRAHKDLDANVSSILFYPTTCTTAERNMRDIAQSGTGIFVQARNPTELIEAFSTFAQNIISITYLSQIAYITGNISMKLFPDSFIEFDYPTPAIPKGIVITAETPPFGNNETTGSFFVPDDASILEANIISYSGANWTHRLSINNSVTGVWKDVFKLEWFGQDYRELGDPYVVNIPLQYLANGNNSVNISASDIPTSIGRGADADKAIYTILREIVGYSKIAGNSSGCKWTITFYDGSEIKVTIPSDYSGDRECSFTGTEPMNNALDNAIWHLLSKLDVFPAGGDYKIDMKFDPNELQIDTTILSGIPYTHKSEVKIVVWR